MTFENVIITDEELAEAIGDWLSKRGITVPVSSVAKTYSGRGAWKVTLEEPRIDEPAPEPKPAMIASEQSPEQKPL